jgi:arylsulfatase
MLSFAGRNETGSSDATPSWAGAVLVANPVAVVGSPDPRPDVILVSLDTVGAQSFLDARRRGLLPHFDRLARRGLDLRRARTNSTTTSTAHSVLLTGRLPARAGNLLPSSGNLAPSSLAERLLAAGYSTTAITGGGLVTERLGHHRGFETFSREDSVFSEALWSQHDIEAIAAKVESWLESDPGGRFLFVHTYEAHGPYLAWPPHETSTPWSAFQLRNVAGLLPLPPERLHELLRVGARGSRALHGSAPADAESALGAARATQQQEMARIDRHLGPLLDRALARESPARTIVLVTADHGEAFFEHGLVEHTLLEESNLQVPLLAVGAGFPSGVASDAVVHTVDIAPTILELLGLDSRTDLDGSSFASGSPRAPRRSERTYAFTGSQGFAWEVADEKWVTFTGLANENFGYAAIAKLGTDAAPRPAGSGDSEPPSPEAGRFALATFDGMPGLHLDLSNLAGRELDVRFGDSRLWNHALHAWDAEPLGEFRSASRARRLRLGEEARIWLLTDRLVAGAELVLADLETGAICRLDRASGWSSARRGPARGCEDGLFSRIRIWRGFAATAFDEGGPLGSDELQKILALGYLR